MIDEFYLPKEKSNKFISIRLVESNTNWCAICFVSFYQTKTFKLWSVIIILCKNLTEKDIPESKFDVEILKSLNVIVGLSIL